MPSESQYDPSENFSFQDIAFNDREQPSILRVHLKASKTDPFRLGVDVFVGRTGNDLCPITAMVRYLSMRGGGGGRPVIFVQGWKIPYERESSCLHLRGPQFIRY